MLAHVVHAELGEAMARNGLQRAVENARARARGQLAPRTVDGRRVHLHEHIEQDRCDLSSGFEHATTRRRSRSRDMQQAGRHKLCRLATFCVTWSAGSRFYSSRLVAILLLV